MKLIGYTTAKKLNNKYNKLIISLASNGNSVSKICSIVTVEARGKIAYSRVLYWVNKLTSKKYPKTQDIETQQLIDNLKMS